MTGRSVKGFHIYWIFTMHTFNNCTWCKHSLHPWHKFEPTVYICTHQYEKSIICPAFTVNFFIVSFLFIHLKPHPRSSPPTFNTSFPTFPYMPKISKDSLHTSVYLHKAILYIFEKNIYTYTLFFKSFELTKVALFSIAQK